jgi:hypothetical protein
MFIGGKKNSSRKSARKSAKKSKKSKYEVKLGPSNAIKYGIKNKKVIKIYPHKVFKKIGRHNFVIKWKTSKIYSADNNFYGKFYKTEKEAKDKLK